MADVNPSIPTSDDTASKALNAVGIPQQHHNKAKIAIGIIIALIIIGIIGIGIWWYISNHSSTPVPSPSPNPITTIKNFIKMVQGKMINPTSVSNFFETNSKYYTNQSSNSCVASLASNAVGWFVYNHTNNSILTINGYQADDSSCSSNNSARWLNNVNITPGMYLGWYKNGQTNSQGYKTLFPNQQYALYASTASNSTVISGPSMSTGDVDAQPGDTIEIHVFPYNPNAKYGKNNIITRCKKNVKTYSASNFS